MAVAIHRITDPIASPSAVDTSLVKRAQGSSETALQNEMPVHPAFSEHALIQAVTFAAAI
jgi:hypothetical protein